MYGTRFQCLNEVNIYSFILYEYQIFHKSHSFKLFVFIIIKIVKHNLYDVAKISDPLDMKNEYYMYIVRFNESFRKTIPKCLIEKIFVISRQSNNKYLGKELYLVEQNRMQLIRCQH